MVGVQEKEAAGPEATFVDKEEDNQ